MTCVATMSAGALDLRFLIREPADVYHGKRGRFVTSHALAEFRACPALFHKKQLGLVPDVDTMAFQTGRGAHSLILEGRDRFEASFAMGGPVNPRTGLPFGSGTKAFTEWADAMGKPALSDDQVALIEQMNAAVREHIFARELLAEGVAEGVVRVTFRGHECQARLDWINPAPGRGIVDLKTADDLSAFEYDARRYGYAHQLAFYRTLVAAVCGRILPVYLIAVEKREPFRCGVWLIDGAVLDQAQTENDLAMEELTRCQRFDVWPTRYEELRLLGP